MAELPDYLQRREERTYTIGDILEKGDINTGISQSIKERFECYAIGIQNGFLTPDEVRRLEELPVNKDVTHEKVLDI